MAAVHARAIPGLFPELLGAGPVIIWEISSDPEASFRVKLGQQPLSLAESRKKHEYQKCLPKREHLPRWRCMLRESGAHDTSAAQQRLSLQLISISPEGEEVRVERGGVRDDSWRS